ncbi:S8 family serine peptidase [Pseudonocardia sp. C8]|uniref:S8 family peptidase n=1 Tax=Pseudonocardia sp. C8 TaxID=2762759 RepID=UPI0016433415|nr:S8 family serine peptidase [Pseudonocardia sp. C8]MBC3190955.1 S8 family serine peptidase [Pseudonocardia sp. C8]
MSDDSIRSSCPDELTHDSRTVVRRDPTRLLLCFHDPRQPDELGRRLQELDLELEPSGVARGGEPPTEVVNHTDRRFWVRSAVAAEIDDEWLDQVERVFGRQLAWIGGVYCDPQVAGRGGLHCPLPNALLVADGADVGDRLREDTGVSRYMAGYRYWTVVEPRAVSAYQVRASLLERGRHGVEDVLFDIMPLLAPYSFEPADTFYPPGPQPGVPSYRGQWNLSRIRAYGPGRTAFDYVPTGASVTIAVLDSGCDLTHPDLLFAPGAGGPSQNGDHGLAPTFAAGHGTMSAGVAAATTHNLKGICGVAGYWANVMPLAFTNVTVAEFSALVGFAVSNGADVLNMSFNVPRWAGHPVTDLALTNAYNNNVVVCGSAGNDNGAVTYPATHARVIAVGATDVSDARYFRSNFGAALSVCAPGVDIPTTMVQGSGNLVDLGRSDWLSDFTGTSAAVPHVAALAAMLRCADPTLTVDEVRNIIEATADRVPPTPYSGASSNGPRSQFLGHGRINALDALLATRPARLRR